MDSNVGIKQLRCQPNISGGSGTLRFFENFIFTKTNELSGFKTVQ